jgi:hypothetical protein
MRRSMSISISMSMSRTGTRTRTRMCTQRGVLKMGLERVLPGRACLSQDRDGFAACSPPKDGGYPTSMMIFLMGARKGRGLTDAVVIEWAANVHACRRAFRPGRDAHARWPMCPESGVRGPGSGDRSPAGIQSRSSNSSSPIMPPCMHACMNAYARALCGHVWSRTRRIWPFPALFAHSHVKCWQDLARSVGGMDWWANG